MRLRAASALLAAAVLVPATAAQAKAPVASCAALAGHRCILLSPASVLRSGSSKGIPWLLVRGSAKGVKIGGTIVVGAGAKDASGLAGYVIGLKHVGDTTAIAAIPPLPGAAKTKAMASGSVSALGLSSGGADSQRTAASSPLALLSPSLLAQLEGVDYGCKSSTAFPLQLTGFSIDPNSGSVAMAPSKGSPLPSAVSVGFQISPAFTAKLNLKEQYQCQAKKELAVTKAIAAIGGIPGIIRTSAEVSAQAGIEGSATGSVKLGFTAGASVTAAGGAVSVQGANFSGTAQVTDPLAVHATGSLQAKTKAVVRLLAYGVWGPRVSLAWGPELKLASLSTDPNTPPENTCSNATLSMPITLAAGVSFEPGIYEGTNAAVRALSESIGGKWVQGLVQTSISALSMGGNPIAMPLEKREFKNVWKLEKALDSGDLYTQDFKPIADQELPTIGNGLTSPNCQPRLTSASFKVTGAQLHYVRVTTFGNCSTIGDTLDTLSWDTEWDSTVDGFDQGPGPLPLAVGRYATTPRIGASGNVVVTNSLMGPCMNPQPGCSSTITYPSSNGPQYSFFRVTAVSGDGAARTYAIHVNAIIDAAGFSSGGCQTSLETAFSPPVTNTDVTLTASGANATGPRTQSFPVTVSRTVTDQGLTFTETWQGTVTLNGYW